MIHTKALYLKCAQYITCSKIKDLNLEIKTSLYFYDPFFIKLYKTALLIYSGDVHLVLPKGILIFPPVCAYLF